MSNPQTTKHTPHEPRRDQTMPRYTYAPTSAQNHTITVRSSSPGGAAQGNVLVNGRMAY